MMFMKRVSKYERMVGTEINGVLVSNYRRIEKVSKTSGKRYYRYEVELNNVLWVSTTSFNKGTYGKRLVKAMSKAPKAKGTYELSTYVFTYGYLRDALINAKRYEYSEDFGFEKSKPDYYKATNLAMDLTIKNYLDTTEDDEEIMKQIIDEMEKLRERQLNDIEAQWAWYYRMTKFARCLSLPEVKKMYRELCSKEHPDKGGDAMKFKAIRKAYEETIEFRENQKVKGEVKMADLFAEFEFDVA